MVTLLLVIHIRILYVEDGFTCAACCGFVGSIAAGNIDVGIAGGVESMTHFDMTSTLNPEKISETVFQEEQARNCLLPMGTTSDVSTSWNLGVR